MIEPKPIARSILRLGLRVSEVTLCLMARGFAIIVCGAAICNASVAPRSSFRGLSSLAMNSPVVANQPGSHTGSTADLVERLSRLTKPERENILSKLPSETRQHIEAGLQRLDKLGAIQKQEALERFRAFSALDPREKDEIRGAIISFEALSERRRKALRSEIDVLQKMSKQQREQHMTADDFKSRFSVDERAILERLTLVMRQY